MGYFLAPDHALERLRPWNRGGGLLGVSEERSGAQGDCVVQCFWAERVCAYGACAARTVAFGRWGQCVSCEGFARGVLLGAGCGDVGGGLCWKGLGEGGQQGDEAEQRVVVG